MDIGTAIFLELYPEFKTIPTIFKFPTEEEISKEQGYQYRCKKMYPGYISYHRGRHCEFCEPM